MRCAFHRRVFVWLVAWLGAVLVVACMPPELLEADDAGQVEEVGLDDVSDGADVDDADTGNDPDVGTDDVDANNPDEVAFGDVAAVVRTSCSAVGTCHGTDTITNFKVEGNGSASDEQVREALEDVQTLTAGLLVEPGEPDQSALYTRLLADDSQAMPPTGPLPDEDIEMVRLWIEQGASYE
jgi:hypothetical protein